MNSFYCWFYRILQYIGVTITLYFAFSIHMLVAQHSDTVDYKSLISLPLEEILKLKVIGVSKYEESIAKAPASVIIITEEQIKDNGYQDLIDILKNSIGIDIMHFLSHHKCP